MQNKRPKKTKFSKYHKGRISYNLPILNDINENNEKELENKLTYKLIALEPCRLTASHITAIELAIKRKLSTMSNITIMNKEIVDNEITLVRKNVYPKLILNAFPHIPVTKKPAEVRMGKGKGSIDYWMTRIKIGSPIVELNFVIPSSKSNPNINELILNKKLVSNYSNLIVKSAFILASSKLSIKTKLIKF